MTPIVRAFALFLFFVASLSAATPNPFTIIGPGGGGAMFHPTISPHDPNTVLVGCDMTGSYITHDGGATWRMFNLQRPAQFFVFDPVDPKTIYTKTVGLWRSRDNGETWTLVYPNPSAFKSLQMNSDHADEKIIADPNPLGDIQALAIDPADSKMLYVTAGTDEKSTLFVSHDFGETWKAEGDLAGKAQWLWVDPRSPKNSRALFIAGPTIFAKKAGSSLTTVPLPDGMAFVDMSLGFAGNGQSVIYATSHGNAFVSTDEGKTWQKCALPPGDLRARAITASFRNPSIAYVSFSTARSENGSSIGIAKTNDAGRTWSLVWLEEAKTPAPNIHDGWITERFGPHWGEVAFGLRVADQDVNLIYATDLGRTMRSTDGGATWNGVYSRRVTPHSWVSTGLDVTTNYGIHFDPFDHQRQFITYTDIGLFRSEDGGASWQSSTEGVPREWLNTTYWLEFDPQVRGRMWSVNSDTHDLPRPKMWRAGRGTARYKGGVCRSDDGGKTWTKSNIGMDEAAATHILLDPTSPKDARILYVSAMGRGVYKSVDDGKTWALKNKGITQQLPLAWRLARTSDGTLYVVIARRSDDGTIGNDGDGALYVSHDAAETWTPVPLPSGANGPNGLAIDPTSSQRLYLATWTRATGMHGEGGGIYISDDVGKSWRHVFDRDQHVYDVTIDPRNPAILYACGFESSAWRSTDRGEHWTRIPGYNFKWGHRVIPDPGDPNQIYITTFGGSVWHGPVSGPNVPRDIATPQLQPASEAFLVPR